MNKRKRYSFSEQTNELGEKNLVPMLPLTLIFQNQSIQEWGLLDTGATVNVLPYRMGLALGLKKETQKTPVQEWRDFSSSPGLWSSSEGND